MDHPEAILFADADAEIRAQAVDALELAGFRVLTAETCALAIKVFHGVHIDMAVIDAHLPGLPGGLELARRFALNDDLPVLALVWAECAQDVLAALQSGASDCVVKPLRWDELVARAQVVLARRRSIPPADGPRILRAGPLALDVSMHALYRDGRAIPLSPIEFRMLRFFIKHAGEVVRKDDLLRHVWGYQTTTSDLNLVDSAIRRLRKLIEVDPGNPACLVTVWGVGYRFDCPL